MQSLLSTKNSITKPLKLPEQAGLPTHEAFQKFGTAADIPSPLLLKTEEQ